MAISVNFNKFEYKYVPYDTKNSGSDDNRLDDLGTYQPDVDASPADDSVQLLGTSDALAPSDFYLI